MLKPRREITSYSRLCRHYGKKDLFKSIVSSLTIGRTMSAVTGGADGKAQSSPTTWFSVLCQTVTASIKDEAGGKAETQKYIGLMFTGNN